MASDNTPLQTSFPGSTSREALRAALGDAGVPVRRFDPADLAALILPPGSSIERPFLLDGDLLFLQPDGTVLVIEDATAGGFLLVWDGAPIPVARLLEIAEPEAEWSTLDDIDRIPVNFILNPGGSAPGSGDQLRVLPGDPLVGLPLNPLLPPTEYAWPERDRDPYFGGDGGVPPGWIDIRLTGLPLRVETDARIEFRPSTMISVGVGPLRASEFVETIEVEMTGLPSGILVSAGALTGAGDGSLTLNFSGTYAEFRDLTLVFPTDFSTQSRNDTEPGPLGLTITVATV